MNGYLVLRDIRPAQNRYRIYEIQMGSITIKEQTYFSVILPYPHCNSVCLLFRIECLVKFY